MNGIPDYVGGFARARKEMLEKFHILAMGDPKAANEEAKGTIQRMLEILVMEGANE